MVGAEILLAIEKMGNFLIEEKNSINRETTEKVERVRNELRLIVDFVADKKLEEGSSLKYWISDVVEIAEDALGIIHGKDPLFYEDLKSIYIALGETRKRILQLGANKYPITSSSPPHKEEEEECVVGLENIVESVLKKSILYEARGLSTLCVVGMAGVGKTTLARKVCKHAAVIEQYECRIWVCLSHEPSNKEVLLKLITQLLHNKDRSHVLLEEMENADNKTLQQMLKQHLHGKNYLIVLDDVGKIPYFKSIFKALFTVKEGRLLLTSRFRSIYYRLPLYSDVYTMKPLDDDRSWQLFLKLLAFGNQEFPKKLEKKGREMLRSCAGLPLSIKEVATQFVMKRQNGSEWEELVESIDLSLTLAVLESVYQRWPSQLKSCFLCLSFFKKGAPVRREKLVQVWTSAQVIPHEEQDEEAKLFLYQSTMDHNSTRSFVEDLLEGYKTTLMMLLDESIIEVDRTKTQRIKCIRVNASFHTLSIDKAKEEMVLETLKKGHSNPPSSHKPRHRAIYCSRDEFNHFVNHDECLISLFFRGGGYFDASEPYWKRFEQLRTLDFEGFGLKFLPESIGTLTELRYLGLRDNHIQELPQSLGRLQNLEVLDIAQNFMMEVSDIVWEISSLRHLYMSDIICRSSFKIDALENLEVLTYISVDNRIYEISSLKMMSSTLRKLGIEEVDENLDVSKLFASLANLRNLESLILRGFRFKSLPSMHGLERLHHLTEIRLDGLINKLPSVDIFPPNISHLSFINSRLDEDPMPELGKLRYLSYLKLRNAYIGEQMVIQRKSFVNLRVLCIEELWHLRNIQVANYLTVLEKLDIKSCPCLESIPKNISKFQLNEMKMVTTKKFAAKIRKLDIMSKVNNVDIQP